eukprot:scaffold93708_cov72-Phaeocystis_antarctica.AAC.4
MGGAVMRDSIENADEVASVLKGTVFEGQVDEEFASWRATAAIWWYGSSSYLIYLSARGVITKAGYSLSFGSAVFGPRPGHLVLGPLNQ